MMEVDDNQNNHLSRELSDVKFKSEATKSYHEASKSKENQKIFKCEHCDLLSCTARGITMHIRRGHPELLEILLKFYCKKCPQRFYLASELKAHLKRKHPRKPRFKKLDSQKVSLGVKCKNCDIVVNNTFRRRVHEHAAAKENEIFQCGHCDFKSCTYKGLTYHTRKYHLETFRFKCSDCGKLFETEDSLSDHKYKRKTACKAFKNAYQKMKFSTNINSETDINSDPTEKLTLKDWCCPKCDASFTTKYFRDKHIDESENIVDCLFCSFKSCTLKALQAHQRTYHYDKFKFECKKCNKRFLNEKTLSNHLHIMNACRRHIVTQVQDNLQYWQKRSTEELLDKTEFEKVYYVLPRPKKGKWIVPLQRIENIPDI